MVYGRTPFAHIRDIGQKIMAIQNRGYVIHFPTSTCPVDERGEERKELAVDVGEDLIEAMKGCLTWEGKARASIPELMLGRFLRPETTGGQKKSCGEFFVSLLLSTLLLLGWILIVCLVDAPPTIDDATMLALVQRAALTFTGGGISDSERKHLASVGLFPPLSLYS